MKTRHISLTFLAVIVTAVLWISCREQVSDSTQNPVASGYEEAIVDPQEDITAEPISNADSGMQGATPQVAKVLTPDVVSRLNSQDTTETVLLEVPGASVTVKGHQIGLHGKTFTARALSEEELHPLGGMCVNVTGGSGNGYRMLPSGEHFNPPAELRVSYNDSLIPLGYKPEDIFTSYYDESTHQWTRLHRVDIDTVNHEIVSLTTHFTDFVNEVLQAPEMPEAQAFVPTMMSDIEPPSPLDGLTVIQPPTANNMGTADLTYPINVPVGRGGLKPNIQLKYSSGNGNGMVGVGWSLPMQCISVETRWGVPLYDDQKETETYLLNGEHLITGYNDFPTFARPYENRDMSGEKRFYPRVEGSFDSIIRHGTTPQTYWWEVVDRDGTHYLYGHYQNQTFVQNPYSTLVDVNGNIAKWMLSEVIDRNGNTMFYFYQRPRHTSGSCGTQIYPDKILYSWNPVLHGVWYGYLVLFEYEQKPQNHTVSGIAGLNEDTEWLLSKVKTKYTKCITDKYHLGPDSLIRSYKLIYDKEDYTDKKHLVAIVELCGDEVSHGLDNISLSDLTSSNPYKLKYHKFEYNTLPDKVFSTDVIKIPTGIGRDAKRGLFFDPSSPLGSTSSGKFNINTGAYFGALFESWFNTINLGGDVTIPTKEKSNGNVMFSDLNGDGYYDIMYKARGGGWKRKLFHPDTFTYDANPRTVALSAPDFSYNTSLSYGGGLNLHLGVELPAGGPIGANGSVNISRSNGTTIGYYTDVNADGLTDIVYNGHVYYNVSTPDSIRFTTSPTEVQLIPGSCENGYYSTSGQSEIFDSLFIPGYSSGTSVLMYKRPGLPPYETTVVNTVSDFATDTMRHSVVRVWIAPTDGTVVATGAVSVNQSDTAARRLSRWDGLRVSIQRNDSLMFSSVFSDNQSTAAPSCIAPVKAGDRIYFRVEALSKRFFDVVNWIPTVSYTSVPADSLDYEGRNKYRYNSSLDYFAWKNEQLALSQHGHIKLDAGYSVTSAMSDTVYLKITKRNVAGLNLQILMNDTVLPGTTISSRSFSQTIEIDSSQSIHIEALSKDEVDWTKLNWYPHARAVELQSMPDGPYTVHTDTIDNNPISDTVFAIDMWLSPKYTTFAPHTLPTNLAVENQSAVCLNDPDSLLGGRSAVIVKRRNGNVVWRMQASTDDLYYEQSPSPSNNFSGGVDIPSDGTKAYYEVYVSGRMPKRYDRNTAIIKTRNGNGTSDIIGLKFDSVSTDTTPNMMAFTPINRQWGQFAYNVGTVGTPIIEDTIHDYFTEMSKFLNDSASIINIMSTQPMSFNTMNGIVSQYAHMPGSVPAERMTATSSSDVVAFVADGSRCYITSTSLGCHEFEQSVSTDAEVTNQIVAVTQGAISIATAGTTVTAPNRTSAQTGLSYHVGVGVGVGYSTSVTDGESRVLCDYMDLNGDGYPDVMGTTTAQYTNTRGALTSLISGIGAVEPGIHNSEYHSESLQAGTAMPLFNKKYKSKGSVSIAQRSIGASLNGDVSTATSTDVTTLQWIDINGDGLPDQLARNGMGLNMGYIYSRYNYSNAYPTFSNYTNPSDASLNEALSASGAGNMIWDLIPPGNDQTADVNVSFSAGLGLNQSENNAKIFYSDINGDGLVDIVTDDGHVQFNSGWGFTSNVYSLNVVPHSTTTTLNTDVNVNVTAGATFGWFKIQGSLGGGYSWSASNTESILVDFDADGLPDIVTRSHDSIVVRKNQCYKFGLLKKVKSFYGNEIEINYAQAGYSPYSRKRPTVMDSVVVKGGDIASDKRYYSFRYKNYRYQTGERTAYGFDTVITRQWDSISLYRITTEAYHNDKYKLRGLKRYESVADAQEQIYVDRTWIYRMKTIAQGYVVDEDSAYCYGPTYPAIDSAFVRYFNPTTSNNDIRVITTERFIHEGYGRVSNHINYNNIAVSDDDVHCKMTYTSAGHDNMNAQVSSILVQDENQTSLRKRTATYDPLGNIASLTVFDSENSGSTSNYTRDNYGNIIAVELPPNGVDNSPWIKKFDYDDYVHQYPIRVIDGDFDDTNHIVYDLRLGVPIMRVTPTKDTCAYIYDDYARLYAVRGPYEQTGNPTIFIQYWDNISYIASGNSPNLVGVSSVVPIVPYTPTTSDVPSSANPVWTQVHRFDYADANFHSIATSFCDGFGRIAQTKENAFVNNTEQLVVSGGKSYDNMGRVKREEEPFCSTLSDVDWTSPVAGLSSTHHRHDILDRTLVDSISPLNITTRYEYDFEAIGGANQFKTAVTDANNHDHITITDPRSLKLQVVDPLNNTTYFNYDALGQLDSVRDPDGFKVKYEYDLVGHITKRIHPDAGTTMWTYDHLGQPISELTAMGDLIRMNYKRDRLIGKNYSSFPENNVTYTYGTSGHNRGRVVRTVSGGLDETFSYGSLGEVVENIRTIALPYDNQVYRFKMTYSYDSWSRMRTIGYPDGEVVTYSYNRAGALDSVVGVKNGQRCKYLRSIRYDRFGHRTSVDYGNGTFVNYNYDTIQRLHQLISRPFASFFNYMQKITYTYDKVNNITAVSNTAAAMPSGLGGPYTNTYTYDDADRLVSASGTGMSLSMAYSPAGRIGTKIQSSSGTFNTNTNYVYAYCNQQQPHAVRRVWNTRDDVKHDFIYDANGNLSQHTSWSGNDMSTRSLYWTEDSRLYASVDDNHVVFYGYDPSGERYIKQIGLTNVLDINAQGQRVLAVLWNMTIYPSPYVVVTRRDYTKHYYIGSDKICTTIGTGGIDSLVQVNSNLSSNATALLERQLDNIQHRILTPSPVSCNTKIDGTTGSDLNTNQIENLLYQVVDSTNYQSFHNSMIRLQESHGNENSRYFYHPDHLGSASWITNSSGQPIQHLQYLPYGETRMNQHTETYNDRYTFSGKEKDSETGYYYFGARYYNSDLSLWLSVDPMSDKYPSLSPYNYCAWNPLKLVDSDGKEIYMLFYTKGNKKGGDKMFKAAALTRRRDIMNNASFDKSKDIVVMCAISDLATIKGTVDKIQGKYGDKYGKTKEFNLWSHGGLDGPTGSVETSSNTLDTKQMTIEGWGQIDFDWAQNATASFFGCNTGVESKGASFAQRLSECDNFSDVIITGMSDYGYPSYSASSYKKHSDKYIEPEKNNQIFFYPTYMVPTNSIKRRFSNNCNPPNKYMNGNEIK